MSDVTHSLINNQRAVAQTQLSGKITYNSLKERIRM